MSSQQDVDRELKAALSVAPSPGFEARVLQRVEADRRSRWAHYGWLTAAASLVIAAGVFYALNRTSPGVPPPPPAQVVEQAPREGVVGAVREPPVSRPEVRKSPTDLPRVQAVPAQHSARLTAPRTAPRTGEPEVIVSLNQMEAVRRLVRAVNEGLIEPPAEPLDGPMAPPEKLAVAPLVIEPVPVPPVVPGADTPAPSIRSLK